MKSLEDPAWTIEKTRPVPVEFAGCHGDRKCLGLPHFSGIGKWDLRETADLLSQAKAYFGNDTGLAHLAEAVGVPAYMVFGPTVPQMGFGPWRPESQSFEGTLWCRPCGKDGRFCFRPVHRYKCLNQIEPQKVAQSLRELR